MAEPWSAQESDRPYVRPVTRTFNPWIAVVIAAIAWIAAIGFHSLSDLFSLSSFEPTPRATPLAPELGSDRPAPTTPAGRVLDAQSAAPSLPKLENSDSMMRDAISGLVGRQAFADHFIAADIVKRIVATVDNLPRETAPRRVMPVNPVPGIFSPDSQNYARYAPYVRVFDAIEPHDLVQAYVRAYPLFQAAYEQLGYPGKYFNDRLMEAIDDLLEAPEPATAPEFMRPRVLYEFAAPDLETRSAGQKMLLRMGRENAARVKGKLREIRRELVAATVRR
ncbi:MAG TPA: DUF3014 domain-containing protein [Burkholderiales bacterium]|nr:DUF3014 domain-containing protein [Burkholderiales bacterium]